MKREKQVAPDSSRGGKQKGAEKRRYRGEKREKCGGMSGEGERRVGVKVGWRRSVAGTKDGGIMKGVCKRHGEGKSTKIQRAFITNTPQSHPKQQPETGLGEIVDKCDIDVVGRPGPSGVRRAAAIVSCP